MKVLFFVSSLAGGGAERVMVDILNHINRRIIEPVLVLLYPYDNSPYKESLPKDIKIVVIERRSNSLLEKIRQLMNFVRTVFKERPHVILSMLTHNNIMALFPGILFRIRVIVCEHIMLSKVLKSREGRRILGVPVSLMVRILYRFADKVIAVSEEIRTELIKKFYVPTRKIQVIYNPVDLDRITELSEIPLKHLFIEEKMPIVIAAGRLVPQKGFDILIESFSMVLSEMDARLIILGEGREEESLKKLAQDKGLEGKVFFAGFQINPYHFFTKADVFVLSSRYEGLPMVILEAMACGVPVISTDCKSGPREILDNGRCGFLVPTEDVRALSKGVVKLLKDRRLRGKLARLGMERAANFSIDKIIKQYEMAIHESPVGQL